jgi:hypothetical protein
MYAAALVLASLACHTPTDTVAYTNTQLAADIAGYETWGSPVGWEGLAISCGREHGTYVRLYANPAAMDALSTGSTLPTGAALVSVSYQDMDGTPKLHTAMRRVGASGEAGGWHWAVLDDAGGVAFGGVVPACAACHQGSPQLLRHLDGPPPARPQDCPREDTGALPPVGGDTG